MLVSVWLRHLVYDTKSLESWERIADSVKRNDLKVCIHLDYKPGSEKLQNDALEIAHTLTVPVFAGAAAGEGDSYAATVFNPAFNDYRAKAEASIQTLFEGPKGSVRALIDADSFDPVEGLKTVPYLGKLLIEKNLLYGVGARDRVVLGEGDLNIQRQVMEMVVARAAGNVEPRNPFSIDLSNVPPAYAEYGDLVPGVVVFNTTNEFFQVLQESAMNTLKLCDMHQRGMDPYTAIKAASFQPTTLAVYVQSLGTPPGSFARMTEVKSEIEKLMVSDIAASLEKSARTMDVLKKHYPEDAVDKVKRMFLGGRGGSPAGGPGPS